MRVVLAQVRVCDDEPVAARVERVGALVRQVAAAERPDLVVLPELWHTGAFASRLWARAAEPLDGPLTAAMAGWARDARVTLHAGSFVERRGSGEHGLTNTSVVFGAGGERLAVYRKIHRFGHGEGESALIDAGDEVVVTDLPHRGGAVATGLSTCYDLRFPELYRAQVDRGAQMLVIPAGWPAARVEHWRLLAQARAVESQCLVLACNTTGAHARTPMGGHSMVVGPDGTVLAEADAEQETLVVDTATDPQAMVAAAREAFPVLLDRVL